MANRSGKSGNKKNTGRKTKGPGKTGGGRGRARKKTGKGLRSAAMIAAAIAAAVALALMIWFGSHLFKPVMPGGAMNKEVLVYVAGEDGLYLQGRAHRVKASSIEEGIRISLELLLKDESWTVPEGTRLKGVEIRDRTAYIDLSGKVTERHTGGSSGEIMTVYSIVNTITLNFPEIKDVQILINGRKEKTLAGHIDISYPIPPEEKFIKG